MTGISINTEPRYKEENLCAVFGFPFEEFVVTNYYNPDGWPSGWLRDARIREGNGDKIDKVKLTKVVNYCAIIVLA